MNSIPDRPSLEGLERTWGDRWEADGIYRFDRTRPRDHVYAIDTPPLTVSGSLHMGHVCSFTHTDLVARFQRMRGKTVFYPIGWDDNGLPTERRVQNHFGVRCDPSMPDDREVALPSSADGPVGAVSRRRFIELCRELSTEDERAFEAVWRRLGLSVDWGHTYTTIGARARQISQRSFLHLLERGMTYRADAPVMWDVDFHTAVAQAELQDREVDGLAYRLRFERQDGAEPAVTIETTRPELLPACVALVAHPGDDRYRRLVGSKLRTPLFGVDVPVRTHHLADPDRGTGLAMVCTFGDLTDVTWWRELALPLRTVIRPDGTIGSPPWGRPGWKASDPKRARTAGEALAGRSIDDARRRVAELLTEQGAMDGPPRPIRHAVKFFEYGQRPVEILSSRQWFVRSISLRDTLLERGRQLAWHPPHMRARFESWVDGLRSDWCISRQRFYGVPFPVWYPIAENGSVLHDRPIAASEDALPVDPVVDAPPGYTGDQRDQPGGFTADQDVMDTWATSSLTPQIAGGWTIDDDLFGRVFPMDLRPQAHDIIRTWLFSTLLRSQVEHDRLPWEHAAISGWILDRERRKMSKSRGNVLTPSALLDRYGADAVRYWAARARLGVDATFDEAQIKVGRRLAIKLLNVARFVLSFPGPEPPDRLEPLDGSMLASVAEAAEAATRALEAYDHAAALEAIEASFWGFCDDHVELVKQRAYGAATNAGQASAVRALRTALSAYLRLLAPYVPYATEEAWSWWHTDSIHRASWPTVQDLPGDGDPGLYGLASEALGAVRRAKAERGLSPGAPVDEVVVHDSQERLASLEPCFEDLRLAARAGRLTPAVGADRFAEIRVEPGTPAPAD